LSIIDCRRGGRGGRGGRDGKVAVVSGGHQNIQAESREGATR
jgi:hypothetical protein